MTIYLYDDFNVKAIDFLNENRGALPRVSVNKIMGGIAVEVDDDDAHLVTELAMDENIDFETD